MLQQEFTPKQAAASTASCVGLRVTYLRFNGECDRMLTGTIVAEKSYQQMRWPYEFIWEYEINPDAGQTNLSKHNVWEGDILKWGVDAPCPACNDWGYLRNDGDLDQPCPICNSGNDSEVF